MKIPQPQSVNSVIAIDVSFSKNTPTTEYAFRTDGNLESGRITFVDTVEKIYGLIESLEDPCALIIRGPLSYYFNHNNPHPRILKHEVLSDVIERGDRAWYLHSGALSALAAQRFLVRLFLKMSSEKEILIVEGLFLNGKDQMSEENSNVTDAELLRDAFDVQKLRTPAVDFSVLDLFGGDYAPPKVLTVRYT